MAKGWTSERRARQAVQVKSWRPWESSTGPKTELGKAIVARNAWKGGHRTSLRTMARTLAEQCETLQQLRFQLP